MTPFLFFGVVWGDIILGGAGAKGTSPHPCLYAHAKGKNFNKIKSL